MEENRCKIYPQLHVFRRGLKLNGKEHFAPPRFTPVSSICPENCLYGKAEGKQAGRVSLDVFIFLGFLQCLLGRVGSATLQSRT